MYEPNNTFPKRMKEARMRKGMSQTKLSQHTGISAATLSTYESAQNPKNPPIDKAIAIAETLGVSLDWLCGLDTKKEMSSNETVENVINAIILLCKIADSNISVEKNKKNKEFVQIDIMDKGICDFVKEFYKVLDLFDNPSYPEYVKDGIRKSLIEKFTMKYIMDDGEFKPIEDAPY